MRPDAQKLVVVWASSRQMASVGDLGIRYDLTPPTALLRSELTLRCLASLVVSINQALEILPHLSVELRAFDDHWIQIRTDIIENLLDRCSFPTRFHVFAGVDPAGLTEQAMGTAADADADLIFFTSGEYLHGSKCVSESLIAGAEISRFLGKEAAICPCDDSCSYRDVGPPSRIVLAGSRHWRSRSEVPTHLIASPSIFKELLIGTEKFASASGPIIRIPVGEVPVFSPMPSLSVQFQPNEAMSPHVEWPEWWNATRSLLD